MIEVFLLLLLLAQNLGEGRPLPACPPPPNDFQAKEGGGREAAIATHPPLEVGSDWRVGREGGASRIAAKKSWLTFCVEWVGLGWVGGHTATVRPCVGYTGSDYKVLTWLREFSSCSCLTALPGPAWVLLSKTFKPFRPTQ